MSPITRASGTRGVMLARYARNRRLADALYRQAFTAITASPGARRYYDANDPHAVASWLDRVDGVTGGDQRLHPTFSPAGGGTI